MKEQWKEIKNYEGYYTVSNKGRVKSLDRTIINTRGRAYHFPTRILNPCHDSDGYEVVTLSKRGKAKLCKVHLLVLEAFLGPRPPGLVGRHEDGNNRNNLASNLLWGTHLENQQDRTKHGRGPQGAGNGRAKFGKTEAQQMKQLREEGWTITGIAQKFQVSVFAVGLVLNNQHWTTRGD